MKRKLLLHELAARPLCCDGAMGTLLLASGLTGGECGMLWNVNRPDDVRAVHEAYRDAGCALFTTNSFGGTAHALARHDLADRVAELNEAAARVARISAGETGWVLGDVGPFGDFLEPLGDTTADELRAMFTEQITALLAGGADAVLIETMSDPAEAVIAIEAAKSCAPDIPVITTFAFQKTGTGEFRTMMGTDANEAITTVIKAGADIVGANCGTSLSLDDYVELARRIVAAAGVVPVVIQPNAGSPRMEGDRTVFDATPEQMANTATQLLEVGVRIVGGCCGTTPAHLAAISRAVERWPKTSH